MEILLALFGDIHRQVPSPWAEALLLVTSFVCGALVGFEREKGHKPAGLRTLVLICVGSAIFTIVSASPSMGGGHEPARIAAQIVTGVGFLGAGSIIHERRQITGLTTAATIWTTSGIGITVGAGYVTGGIVMSVCVLFTLVGLRRLEVNWNGPCSMRRVLVVFDPRNGKTRVRIGALIDDGERGRVLIESDQERPDGMHDLTVEYCDAHRDHRCVLAHLAEMEDVVALKDLG